MPIIKVLSRSKPTFRNLLQYIVKGAQGRPEIFVQNLRSNDVPGWTREFLENESFRQRTRKDQVYMFHEIISFGTADQSRLTHEVMADLVAEYMRLRGRDGVMLAAVHREAAHVHLHVCTSALKYRTGTSFRIEKPELQKLKAEFQRYHEKKYPGIAQSSPEHGKGKPHLTDRAWWAAHKELRAVAKERISEVIRECFAKASTGQEFLDLLRESNLSHYERGGKPVGILDEAGNKYRFSRLLEKDEFESLPIVTQEEDQILAELRSIREQNKESDLDERER